MNYCINPNCKQPYNSDDSNVCLSCGTSLLINNCYRATRSIMRNESVCTEIFEVEQVTPNEGKKRKILKAIHDNGDITSSGEKLFALLSKLFNINFRYRLYK